MERFVVNGLDMRSRTDIAQHVASLGFNCIRLVFSNDMYFKNPDINATAVTANADLAGKSAMYVFDEVIKALTGHGLMVILNNHNSHAQWCCDHDDGSGLWYSDDYPTAAWQSMWVDLAERYKTNPWVIGADLRNEIRRNDSNAGEGARPTWGTGNNETDWKIAAQDCGNAVLATNRDWLIFVEGLEYAQSLSVGMGSSEEDLCRDCLVQQFPIQLDIPNRLVYSGHVYPWSSDEYGPTIGQKKFDTSNYSAFETTVRQRLTYVTTPGYDFTAPFWLGEFGDNSPGACWNFTIELLAKNPTLHWAYWAIDGYKHAPGDDESFGLFEQDYETIRHPWKLADLQSVMTSASRFVV